MKYYLACSELLWVLLFLPAVSTSAGRVQARRKQQRLPARFLRMEYLVLHIAERVGQLSYLVDSLEIGQLGIKLSRGDSLSPFGKLS